MNTLKRFHLIAASCVMPVAMLASASHAQTVVVSPANMNGWALNTFDPTGNIVTGTGGTYDGTATLDYGPATPPLGVGSAHLATPVGEDDGAAAIATDNFDGTPLASITALSYSAYDVTNNGQQFPYLGLKINTGAIDNSGDGGTTANIADTLFFEPPYQQPATGNPSLPDQGPTAQNTWQSWNALTGGFWDNDNLAGMVAGGGQNNVQSLSTFLSDYPAAYITYGGAPGLGGVALRVGFAGGSTEDGYVDAFSLGTAAGTTTYDFEPTPVPEPASMGLVLLGGPALLMRRRKRQA
jgi:hypothetical protein